ncbi:transglycosylase SLT domain-containing protein [Rhodohalobacter barkolensis]|uniref:Lytic transglycosylase F n=1 Tax=Rhodohalobacter barkolensis TaxID=2053187 RepID=A0A2N0VH77_9BACT|nr:transporter substrate-binding domain-containing protein [Rhodohalobacter barkolensis]PKD43542.1 lytic transglycosylase F [Rhodohalobacter barkolensis]
MKAILHENLVKGRVYLLLSLFLTSFLFAVSCSVEENVENEEVEDEASLPVSVLEPVQRDLAEIKESGVLRMITYYSSNTYFLNQGIEVGFEYELVKEFARENDLALEVVIVGADENPFDLLNSGQGDLIAANYTITPERRDIVRFTRPYNLVDQMLVFSSQAPEQPQTLEELSGSGISVSVRRNSSYFSRLQDLIDEGYEIDINIMPDAIDTEAALMQVGEGELMATVADDNMFDAANRYMDGLFPGPKIAERDTIAWAIRQNAPDLESTMNRFLYKHFRFTDDRENPRRSTFLNILRKRYFEESRQIAEFYNPEWQYQTIGIISPYDDIVKSVADSLNLDWLMLTAMIAQESSFNPNSKSWAGAVGLMQVIPRFVETEYEQLYDPVTNIKEGARIIKEHLSHYSYMDSTNQWQMALATYNVGQGHMADARRLVIDQNKNPNEWENVSGALLMLMQRRYYQEARYGFARGIEPVQYVKEIMNRYRTYEAIIALAENQQRGSISNAMISTGLSN